MTIPEIGAIHRAEQEREGYRKLMRESQRARRISQFLGTQKEYERDKKEYANYKRLFRKARNRALWLKEQINAT